MSLTVSITAVPGIPDIQNGDDLAAILGDCLEQAGLPPQDGDILCIAQKVFSKAEGCIIPLSTVTPSDEAIKYGEELNKDPRKVEIVLRESTRVVRSFRRPDQPSDTMICEHRLGFISQFDRANNPANAGAEIGMGYWAKDDEYGDINQAMIDVMTERAPALVSAARSSKRDNIRAEIARLELELERNQ